MLCHQSSEELGRGALHAPVSSTHWGSFLTAAWFKVTRARVVQLCNASACVPREEARCSKVLKTWIGSAGRQRLRRSSPGGDWSANWRSPAGGQGEVWDCCRAQPWLVTSLSSQSSLPRNIPFLDCKGLMQAVVVPGAALAVRSPALPDTGSASLLFWNRVWTSKGACWPPRDNVEATSEHDF